MSSLTLLGENLLSSGNPTGHRAGGGLLPEALPEPSWGAHDVGALVLGLRMGS